MVGSTVKERPGLGERSDQVLRPEDPADTPARKAPVLVPHVESIMLLYFDYGRLHLGETVHDDDRVTIDVVDVLRRGDRLAVILLVFRVEVPRVELRICAALLRRGCVG